MEKKNKCAACKKSFSKDRGYDDDINVCIHNLYYIVITQHIIWVFIGINVTPIVPVVTN